MMKLTREQISALSDVELNRGMMWCYPRSGDYAADGTVLDGVFGHEVNYITDYNLTMPLAFAKRASIININGTTQWFACNNVSFETICMSPDGSDDGVSCMDCSNQRYSTKPLRAICEVLLMIAMEREA